MDLFDALARSGPVLRGAIARGNLAVLRSMLGPAFRGLIERRGSSGPSASVRLGYSALFDWKYARTDPAVSKLYEAAKTSQWNSNADLDWTTSVDPEDPERPILPDSFMPLAGTPVYDSLEPKQKAHQRHLVCAWMLSQFLHGEQAALFAASQVTEAVPWLDAKLYGSTQVIDEGRHVETFHRYLTEKLERLYKIDDNLYVVIDALMSDSRWDLKFLGMQIMIEGLALGAFCHLRAATSEPLLRRLLTFVIGDEARHVHYGVLALGKLYREELGERERREREDWAFEVALLLKNRFLAHELYDQSWAHRMSRAQWDRFVLGSQSMQLFRFLMFRRLVPNLKRIGLLSDRVRGRYQKEGLLQYETGRAATELTAQDLIEDR